MQAIHDLLEKIYGPRQGQIAFERLTRRIKSCGSQQTSPPQRFSQKDAVLITYGDSLRNNRQTPLQTLYAFARTRLKGCFSTIHFLPFFPYSSDDGFSVMDFFSINPNLGTWQDVACFSPDFNLMFDYVLNHVSSKSQWFTDYLAGHPDFSDLAIAVDPSLDLSLVTRPRALPLLTPYTKTDGEKVYLWTTFSADQIDLNYQSIDVFLHMVDVLLFYVQHGARWLRLDAVAYLWKEIGTPCIHHDKTHDMIRLLRKILDQVAPEVIIITETNVPHNENIRYFGNGLDEAQLVYNFTLPPLLLHTFTAGDASRFAQWAGKLKTPGDHATFFNFTASHDGIGVRPLEGILSHREINDLAQHVVNNGGQVSYRQNSDGSESPYELNITYVDALRRGDPLDARRFLASQAIQLALPGVPAVYIHSILGSRNWSEGVHQTGLARTINREKLEIETVEAQLEDQGSYRSKIFYPYCHMLQIRCAQAAFHPNAAFDVLSLDRRLFAIKRWCEDQTILALTNISLAEVNVPLKPEEGADPWLDLLTRQNVDAGDVVLQPYQTMWLVSGNDDKS